MDIEALASSMNVGVPVTVTGVTFVPSGPDKDAPVNEQLVVVHPETTETKFVRAPSTSKPFAASVTGS